MIKITAIGHLGGDATLNNINSKSVLNFTLASSEKYKDQQGNQKEKTTWVSCSWWTDRTAIQPYLKKGTQIFVEGVPEAKNYTDKNGQSVAQLSVRVTSVQLLGGKSENSQTSNTTNQSNASSGFNSDLSFDDAPF